MVAGGIFNAFAFAGAGYLFKMINSDGYGKEIKRHNLAMEQLARARQEWNQKEIEQRRKQLELRQERSDANEDFKEINKSLKDYKKVSDLEIIYNGKKFTREPHIWDFYHPSDEMKEYMTLAIGMMGLVGGWTGGKIISQLL